MADVRAALGESRGSVTSGLRVLKAVAAVFLSFTCCRPSPHSREDSPPAFLEPDSFCHEKEACDLLPSQSRPGEGICRPRSVRCPLLPRRAMAREQGLKRAGQCRETLVCGDKGSRSRDAGWSRGGLFHCQRAILKSYVTLFLKSTGNSCSSTAKAP